MLIGLVPRADGLRVLLTQRTDHLTDHPGQISFPGGRAEPEDDGPIATALREATEEIGLDPRLVEVLGWLPTYTTGTGFVVTPVVALVDPAAELAESAAKLLPMREALGDLTGLPPVPTPRP